MSSRSSGSSASAGQAQLSTWTRDRLLRRRSRSRYLEWVCGGASNQNHIRMHRCPLCERPADEWAEDSTARHFQRDDHTWDALVGNDESAEQTDRDGDHEPAQPTLSIP